MEVKGYILGLKGGGARGLQSGVTQGGCQIREHLQMKIMKLVSSKIC